MPPHSFRRPVASLLLCVVAASLAATTPAPAASSAVTVSTMVTSATSLAATACTGGDLVFGPVTAGATIVTASDCTIVFGSSNNTSQLRVVQADQRGVGMFQLSRGAPDATFDGDGSVVTSVAAGGGQDEANDAAILPDGDIVAVGQCDTGGPTGNDLCLVRYDAAGALDGSFGTGGRVITPIGGGAGTDTGRAVAAQADGKLVAVGTCDMGPATLRDVCVARYDAAGSLDPSFSGDGLLTISPSGDGDDQGRAVQVQPDGKIVVGGFCDMYATTGGDFCAMRLATNGSFDTSFGGTGIVTTPVSGGSGYDELRDLELQADGTMLATGYCAGGATGMDACAVRYAADGSLDATFDGDGRVITATAPGGAVDSMLAVAGQPDGKVVVAGDCALGGATGKDICLNRYTAAGALDPAFGTGGQITAAVGPGTSEDYAQGLLVQPDGRIVVAGYCDMGPATNTDICVLRFLASGLPDPTFDGDGRLVLSIATGTGMDEAMSLELQSDGRLLAVGKCSSGGATGVDFCLASFAAAGTVQDYANGSADWDTVGTSLFGMCLRNLVGATADLGTNVACPSSDGAWWNAAMTTPTVAAHTTSVGASGTADLRFGLRTTSSLPTGDYVAPLTFDVIAP